MSVTDTRPAASAPRPAAGPPAPGWAKIWPVGDAARVGCGLTGLRRAALIWPRLTTLGCAALDAGTGLTALGCHGGRGLAGVRPRGRAGLGTGWAGDGGQRSAYRLTAGRARCGVLGEHGQHQPVQLARNSAPVAGTAARARHAGAGRRPRPASLRTAGGRTAPRNRHTPARRGRRRPARRVRRSPRAPDTGRRRPRTPGRPARTPRPSTPRSRPAGSCRARIWPCTTPARCAASSPAAACPIRSHDLRDRQRPPSCHLLAEALPREELHHQERRPLVVPHVEHHGHIRMDDPGHGLGMLPEHLGRGRARVQHLHGHGPVARWSYPRHTLAVGPLPMSSSSRYRPATRDGVASDIISANNYRNGNFRPTLGPAGLTRPTTRPEGIRFRPSRRRDSVAVLSTHRVAEASHNTGPVRPWRSKDGGAQIPGRSLRHMTRPRLTPGAHHPRASPRRRSARAPATPLQQAVPALRAEVPYEQEDEMQGRHRGDLPWHLVDAC